MIVDFLGREIRVGDTVVYPCRSGSTMWLTNGEVIDFADGVIGEPFRVAVRAKTESGVKRTGMVPVDRCIVVV
jgi:hypothetical protein